MPNNEEQTRIMDKIAKLLALAQSSNPNEAAIALSRAQKLMEEHKVTQRDVSFSSMGEKTEAIPTILRDRQLYTRLGHMIARAFGVANIYNFKNERITSITFLGDLARVESATYAFTVLGVSQLFHAIGMRDVETSVLRMNHLENRLMIAAFSIGLSLQILVTEIPYFVAAFGTCRLSLAEWIRLILLAAAPLLAHEILLILPGKSENSEKKLI